MNLKNPFNNNKKSSKSYLLKNGFVIDPEKKKIEKNDILIKNTLIEKIGKSSLSIMHALFVDGKCKSTAKSILAYADLQKNKPKTISKELKLQIKNILRGGASDEI